MKKYKVILFDLDGTLSDPREGITKSIQFGLGKIGIIENDRHKLEGFIGPPLIDSFMSFYDLDKTNAQEAIRFYRERFGNIGMYENILFHAIPALLKDLSQEYHLAVATSKPTEYAKPIVQFFNINHYFDHIIGSHLDGSRVQKTEVIAHLLTLFHQFTPNQFIMIGDRKFDLIGAKENKLDSIAVTYGFGSLDELKQENPTYIVDTIDEIRAILL